jgi:hypothetical protein
VATRVFWITIRRGKAKQVEDRQREKGKLKVPHMEIIVQKAHHIIAKGEKAENKVLAKAVR